jgi:pimeloyl-ACP methyl ester carboxylesterase
MKKSFRKLLPKLVGLKLNSLFFVNPQLALEQAFYLFCAPRRGKPEAHESPFLDSAKSEKIKIGNVSTQVYRWNGTKEKVLLLHGWESNTYRWKDLIDKLQAENYDITALDAPAHGNSSGKLFNVPLYAKFVQVLIEKHKPDFVVGHSVGAMTADFQQHMKPSKNISKLVLLGPPSELTEIMADFQEVFGFHQKFMEGLEKFFQKKFDYTFEVFSTARFAKSLKMEGLIIHDKFDKIAPVSASEAIAKNWGNSRLIITEGMGHSLNNENVLDEVVGFLNSKAESRIPNQP